MTMALELCTLVSIDPTHELDPYLAPVFAHLRRDKPDDLMAVAEGTLDSGSAGLRGSAAIALSSWPSESWNARDTALLSRLLLNEDARLRELSLPGLRPLAECDRALAIELALRTEIGDSVPLARALCELFVGPFGLSLAALDDVQVEQLLKKLEYLGNLDDSAVQIVLTQIGTRNPSALVNMLLRRVTRAGQLGPFDYQPLPMKWMGRGIADVSVSERGADLLRRIRDAILSADTWGALFVIPELFAAASGGFGELGINVLNEWVDSGDPAKIKDAQRAHRQAHGTTSEASPCLLEQHPELSAR